MVPENISQGLKYKMKCMAQYSYIDLHTNVNPMPSEQIWPQKAKIILNFLTCLIYDWFTEVFVEMSVKRYNQKCS